MLKHKKDVDLKDVCDTKKCVCHRNLLTTRNTKKCVCLINKIVRRKKLILTDFC